jgi:hypothetical protein
MATTHLKLGQATVSPDWHRFWPIPASPEGNPQHRLLFVGKVTGQFVPLMAPDVGSSTAQTVKNMDSITQSSDGLTVRSALSHSKGKCPVAIRKGTFLDLDFWFTSTALVLRVESPTSRWDNICLAPSFQRRRCLPHSWVGCRGWRGCVATEGRGGGEPRGYTNKDRTARTRETVRKTARRCTTARYQRR